jgi:hypothetical protein
MHPYQLQELTSQRHQGFHAEAEAHRRAKAVVADTPRRRRTWRRRTAPVTVALPQPTVAPTPAV